MSSEQKKQNPDKFCVKQFHSELTQFDGPSVFRSAIEISKPRQSAVIVIDSGFNAEALESVSRIIGLADLTTGKVFAAKNRVTDHEIKQFAGDPLNHGSIVLAGGHGFTGLAQLLADDTPFILIRAFGNENCLLRTQWRDGHIYRPGWTEAYRWAVGLCRQHNLSSVANCSFGGFSHAMDGTGWESRQLKMDSGSGHIVVSATGPGDGQPVHASWSMVPGQTRLISAEQKSTARYNLWSAEPPTASISDFVNFGAWTLTVQRNGKTVHRYDAAHIVDNLWNQRKQIKFVVEGEGLIEFIVTRHRARPVDKASPVVSQRFDCWIEDGQSHFRDHVDPTMVSEPAVFPHVLAVGLESGKYGPHQMNPNEKPDILLPGDGPISFRIPAISAMVARLLNEGNHHLDVNGLRSLIGKTGTMSATRKRESLIFGRKQMGS